MRLEQNFVIPLPVEDARRLVAELERFAPMVPGLAVRIEIDPRDARSTAVRVVGELRTGGGIAKTVAAEAAARVLRQYVARLTQQAQSWAASRSAAPPGPARETDGGTPPVARDASTSGSPDSRMRDRAPFASGGRTDVWSSVTDPVGGQRRPARASSSPRPRGADARQLSARDVVAVTGVALAFAIAHRAVRRRLAARVRARGPAGSELPPRVP